MKKLLFFDVDGTLYNSEKKLPASTKEAMFQARANGHELAIATGRAPFMIQQLLDELEIDTYVTFNGQYVVYKGEVIFTDRIPNEELEQIIAYGEERQHSVVFLDDRQMIASVDNDKRVQESLDTLNYPYPIIDATYYKQNPVYQTLLFVEEQEQLNMSNDLVMCNLFVGIKNRVICCQKGDLKQEGLKKSSSILIFQLKKSSLLVMG